MTPRHLLVGFVLFGGFTDLASGQPVPPVAEGVPPPVVSPAPAGANQIPAATRDPFRPFINARKNIGGGDEDGPKFGLLSYDLRQLKVVAVLWNMNPPRALLQDAAGMGFIVTPGMPIGRRKGVIAAIEPGRIVVEEKEVDFYNKEQVTREVLEISKEDQPQDVGRGRK